MTNPDNKGINADQTPTPSAAEITQQTHTVNAGPDSRRITLRRMANAAAIGSILVALGSSAMNKSGGRTPRPPFIATKHNGGPEEMDAGSTGTMDASIEDADDEVKPDSTDMIGNTDNLEAGITDTRILVESDLPDVINIADATADVDSDANADDAAKLDPCQVELVGAVENPKPENANPNNPCYHEIYKDGSERWDGFPIIDKEGKRRTCFFTRPFAPEAALRLNGTIRGSNNDVGDISLDKGELCVRIVKNKANSMEGDAGNNSTDASVSENINSTNIFINAEAAVAVKTDQAVLLYRYEEKDPASGTVKTYLDVVARAGKTVINQAGGETIILKEGEGRKISLDINYVSRSGEGCYIASPSDKKPNADNGKFLLTAGAIFLALRRRKAQ